MMLYELDILDAETGHVRRTPMHTGWTKHAPANIRARYCDCAFYGYRERGYLAAGEWVWAPTQYHETTAWMFLQSVGCDHSMPPKRYSPVRAYIKDGRVYDFATESYVQATAT